MVPCPQKALQRQVQGLGGIGREDYARWVRSVEEARQSLATLGHHPSCFCRTPMLGPARAAGDGAPIAVHRHVHGLGFRERGGGVVQVDGHGAVLLLVWGSGSPGEAWGKCRGVLSVVSCTGRPYSTAVRSIHVRRVWIGASGG